MYTLIFNGDNIATCKSINYLEELGECEIEITEEQYNEIEVPCIISVQDDKVVSWIQTTLPSAEPEPKPPTLEERLQIAEETINFLLGI